jgi:hypothetical protein
MSVGGRGMTLQDLGSVGELVGAIATVATLGYLAIQIRSNTKAVQSAAAQSVHENYATWYHLMAGDAELAGIAVKGLRDYSDLSEVEKARLVATLMAFLSYSQNAFIKWREGTLSPELWLGWEVLMVNLVGSPGGLEFWKERSYVFGEEFRNYVEGDIMTREPHPNAKPLGAFSIANP